MADNEDRFSRRNVLKGTGVAVAAGLAGCGGNGNGGNGNGGNGNGNGGNGNGNGGNGGNGNGGNGGSMMKPIELLHAWSSGDGNEAIAALIEGFREEHPDVEFADEPVNGAARSNLDQVVANRLQANDPPSTFQTWPGKTLQKFGDAYTDIEGDVWTDELKNNYLPGPREQAQLDGTFVTVPVNIHRINNLFYNTSVVEATSVDPASLSSPADVVDACETIASETDAVPFAHQTSGAWSTGQLFGSTLLAVAGADSYEAFINGEGDRSDVVSALEHIVELREYYPGDSSSISFTEANTMVIEGDAAFIHQGDWAAGAYTNTDGFAYGDDWDHVTYPGSEGNYQLNMDSFPYFDENPSPEATKAFLRYCGGTKGQVEFNAKKGSIPPRQDADVSQLNQFQQDQFDDFTGSDDQPPSIQHGLAVAPAVLTNMGSAFSSFLESYDVESTADALMGSFE